MALLILLIISSITLQATQAKVATQVNTLGLEDNLLWEKFKLQVMSNQRAKKIQMSRRNDFLSFLYNWTLKFHLFEIYLRYSSADFYNMWKLADIFAFYNYIFVNIFLYFMIVVACESLPT